MDAEFSPSITLGRWVGSSSSQNQTTEKCFAKEMSLSEKFLICKNKQETVAIRKEENKANKGTLN